MLPRAPSFTRLFAALHSAGGGARESHSHTYLYRIDGTPSRIPEFSTAHLWQGGEESVSHSVILAQLIRWLVSFLARAKMLVKWLPGVIVCMFS